MGEQMHHGGAAEAFLAAESFLLAANIGEDTDNDSSSVQSSSTESMADVVIPGLEGNERDDTEAEGDGGSQYEEDSLDNDESTRADSDSTGSLADFIAPEWEVEGGEEGDAVEDDDYEEGSSTEEEEDGDEGDDGPKRAYSLHCDAISRLEMIVYHLPRLAHESEAESGQRAVLHHDRSCYCRCRGRRTTRVPPPLRRAGESLVVAPHNNAESNASPLSSDWRRRRRRARRRPVG